jgi:hypothetical protein
MIEERCTLCRSRPTAHRQVAEVQQDGADVGVLELDGNLRAVELLLQSSIPLGFVRGLPGQFRLQHGEVVGDDELDFVASPVEGMEKEVRIPDA